tara:strand:- start:315 stop:614 length:300 start_codon:yes stop_codon:yes gene_type:complete
VVAGGSLTQKNGSDKIHQASLEWLMPTWAIALRLIGVGWFLATSIIVGIVVGLLLDKWLETKIFFTLLGVLVGTMVAFYGLYHMVKPLMDVHGGGSNKE